MPGLVERSLAHRIGGPAIVFAVALVVRGICLWELSHAPGFGIPFLDEDRYLQLARAIAAGQAVDDTLHWQSPLYPWLLGQLFRAVGDSPAAIQILQIGLGAATCVWTFAFARQRFGTRTAWISGLALALYGPAIFACTQILATTLAMFFVMVLVFAIDRYQAQPRTSTAALVGAITGAAILTRPFFLTFALAGGAWWLYRSLRSDTHGRPRLAHTLAAVSTTALLLSPALVHRKASTDQFALLPVSGPLNLHLGNNAERCDTIRLRGQAWDDYLRAPTMDRPTPEGGWRDHHLAPTFAERVSTFAARQPLEFAQGLGHKSLQLVHSTEIPRNVDIYVFREWSWIVATTTWRLGPFGAPFGFVIGLAAFCGVFLRQNIPAHLWLMLLAAAGSSVLVFASGRYRLPIVPVLLVLAAAGIPRLVDAWRSKSQTPASSGIAIVTGIAVTLLSLAPTRSCEDSIPFAAEYQQIVGTHHLRAGDPELARTYLLEAVKLDPENVDALYNLGHVYAAAQQWPQAVERWERVHTLAPAHQSAARSLASALLQVRQFGRAHPLLIGLEGDQALTADEFARIGLGLARERRFEDASPYLDTAAERGTTIPDVYALVAHRHKQAKRLDRAAHTYATAIATLPKATMFRIALAQLEIERGRPEAARPLLQRVLEGEPEHAQARGLLQGLGERLD